MPPDNTPTLTILQCGLHVKTLIGNIEGMITAASIRFDKVSYEISYFNSGEQRSIFMNEKEFKVQHFEDNKYSTIGFTKQL